MHLLPPRQLCGNRTPRFTKMKKTMTQMLLSADDQAMLMKALQSKSPDVVQARMANALLLLSDGLSVEDVAGLLFLAEDVVAGWQRMFTTRMGKAA